MTTIKLNGIITELPTPFENNPRLASIGRQSIDYPLFAKLVEKQVNAGVSGILTAGLTGESSTTNFEEKGLLINILKCVLDDQSHNSTLAIASTGRNSTFESIELTKTAETLGMDAALLPVPYYYAKTKQNGLFEHFSAIADNTDIPLILHNVSSIAPETVASLANKHSNFIGINEASGNQNYCKEIQLLCPKGFQLLSGNDQTALKMACRYKSTGLFSVASNLIPDEMSSFMNCAISGDLDTMEQINNDLTPLFKALIAEQNPIPLKAAMNIIGHLDEDTLRYPLTQAELDTKNALHNALKPLGLIH